MKRAKSSGKGGRARRADARDAEIGRRVRSRRLECRLTQTELADRIGVTFQQVQKYEKGLNRIGAGRLHRIANALEVPITFFFSASLDMTSHASTVSGSVFEMMQTPASLRVVRAFHKIRKPKTRQLLVAIAEKLAAT